MVNSWLVFHPGLMHSSALSFKLDHWTKPSPQLMNFVCAWLWRRCSAGSAVVIIDQAWRSALKPAGNAWREKMGRGEAWEISKQKMSCTKWGRRSFAKNGIVRAWMHGRLYLSVWLCQRKAKLGCWRGNKTNKQNQTVRPLENIFHWHVILSASAVNKHKPWIETSYHGVITENTDIVLLDPPLVALDKDAPVPYAGKIYIYILQSNCFQLEKDQRGVTENKWEQWMITQVLIRPGRRSCRVQ